MLLGAALLLSLGLWDLRHVLCADRELCFPSGLRDGGHPDRGGEGDQAGRVLTVRAFRQEFVIELQRDSEFIAGSGPQRHLSRCFYSGSVNRDRDSYAALSLCGGARGAFGLRGWDYFLSPAANDSSGHAHILQRTSGGAPRLGSGSRCAVSDGSFGAARILQKYGRAAARDNTSGSALARVERTKRFASVPRYVETLLVADESMVAFHGDDLTHYLLTLMAVAARLYKHASILNSISVTVVRVLALTDRDDQPRVSTNAAVTLRDFCTWQKKVNRNSDRHPEHWDTAILFTRQDLCGASTCDTLGMADVGTMCDPKRSCSVIEDDGLPSAFTTAHELGHVLNMPHDNVRACEDVFGTLHSNHMMSPTLIQINRSHPWSACSAAIITDFLDSGHGDCLLDQPHKPLVLPNVPPGSSYNLERQCQLAFGGESKPCPFMEPPCSRLWCTGISSSHLVCMSRHFPWADGTECGDNQVCEQGVCVDQQAESARVDGRWGRWGLFGSCSRTCGGGVQLSKRECDNPTPSNGGKYCQGVRVKYRSCNLNRCPDTGKTYREEQCETSGERFNTNHIHHSAVWVPKYSGVSPEDRCKLICRGNGTGYFYVLAPKVVDGTPCSPESTGVCVQGKCVKAGCDGKIGSTKKFDKCGTCGGDNKSCKKVSGLFTKPMPGYNFVVMLPVGAANIDIRQRGYKGLRSDNNFLAVKNADGRYLLNGNYIVSAGERDVAVKNSLLRYSGTTGVSETLQAVKPLGEALTVEVLCAGQLTPPRIRYSFYLPRPSKEEKTAKKEARVSSHNSILREDSQHKDDALKASFDKDEPASAKWISMNWDACSVTCGRGVQRRLLQCQRPDGKLGADCDAAQRPAALRICEEPPCPQWQAGAWSACSTTCGKGFRRRPVQCRQTVLLLPRERCSNLQKPQELDFCNPGAC